MTAGSRRDSVAADTALERFERDVCQWVAAPLDAYVDAVQRKARRGALPTASKEVNDAIWGTIVISPLETVVLDSPLLQRLRYIRQLGVAHFVYPSAVHTRFEHSLGALQQVTRVVDSINAHAPVEHRLITLEMERLLRLAALCHDIGHGVMSHVAENALANFEAAENIRLEFSEREDVEKPPLSEIAAYFVLGSDSFRTLIEEAERLLRVHDLPRDGVELLRKAIIGRPISEEIPLLHELISGPFDADKLDYMTRDARTTGVPVVTDIPRLVQKVRATQFALNELPDEVRKLVEGGGQPAYWLTGIALSGGRTLDELLIGRTLLFDKLYRHHKVRACEAMVAAIFCQVADVAPGGPLQFAFTVTDDDLLNLDRTRILRIARRELGAEEETRASIAEDLARRLKWRNLFVRAFAFAQNMPLDPYRGDRAHVNGLRILNAEATDSERRSELVAAIATETRRICAALGADDIVDELPSNELTPFIWIDPPQPPTGGTVVAQAYLLEQGRRWLRFGEESAEAPGWTNAYLLTRDIGYVFTTVELAPYVFLAAERVVRERYRVRTARSTYGYAKQEENVVDELKMRLAESGYYAKAPPDLRPAPERLRRGDVSGRLTRVAERLAGYQGPVREEELKEERRVPLANPERMRDWLRQFEDDELIDAGLRVLEQVTLVGRHELVTGVNKFLAEHAAYRGGSICPLGEPKDSSSILAYEALDVSAFGMRSETLAAALAERRPVVFVDDFVGRGSQAKSILESWLGERPSDDLGEERGPALDEPFRDVFKSLPVAIVFSAGDPAGAATVEDRARELGLNVVVEVSKTALPTALDERLYEDVGQRDRFVDRCREIGEAVLVEPTGKHDAAWAADRALGYGNGAYLVLFPYNTPAQTLTCLWKGGTVDGVAWEPLFPRRKKR